MKKDSKIFLKHILESIEKIEKFTKGFSKKRFFESIKTQDAVIRRLEIIGEATKNLPEEFREKYTEVPWSELARMRDKLIYGYFGIDLNLTFEIANKDLPKLKSKISKDLRCECRRTLSVILSPNGEGSLANASSALKQVERFLVSLGMTKWALPSE